MSNEPQQLAKSQNPVQRLRAYANHPEVIGRFKEILGDYGAKHYLSSILTVVANDDRLQKCTPKSIMLAGIKSATLGLSVDKDLKQAHLVAYGDTATLIPDYHGLVMLMENTGQYRFINVSEVFDGEEVRVNRFTGAVEISGSPSEPRTVKGYCGYFEKRDGYTKYLYMTNEECDAHGKKYNPRGFGNEKGIWNTDRPAMRRKTVLRLLCLRWGHFSPIVERVLKAEESIDGEVSDLPEEEVQQDLTSGKSTEEILNDLGY